MDSQIVKGKWNEFKGEMRKMWGNLTDNDLEQTKGNVKAIGGLLQQKYGQMKDDTRAEFDRLVKRFGHEASVGSEAVKEDLREDKH